MTEHAQNLVGQAYPSTEATESRLAGGWLLVARFSWVLLAMAALGVLLASLPGYSAKFGGQLAHDTGGALPPGAHFFAAASGVASLASALLSVGLSALLFRRKFTEPIAVLLSFFLLSYGVVMSGPLEFASAHWLGSVSFAQTLQGVLLATPMIALLMLFPNGQFVPGWTRWLVLLSVPWSLGLLWIDPFEAESFSRHPLLSALLTALFLVFVSTGFYAQIYRYRYASTPTERQQARWAVYGFALWVAYILLSSFPYFYLTGLPAGAPTPWWGPASELGWFLGLNILPLCLTIAITRHRLWDIDLVVNRTLVYGALTASVLALYALIVGGMGLLFRADGNLLLPLLATGLAAVLFEPLRLRLQHGINRMMYGDRDDPSAILDKLGSQLEGTSSPEAALSRIVETIARTLKLPYAAIELGDGWTKVTSFGLPTHAPLAFPLIYQGETIGQMAVSGRDPDGELTPKDMQLLENLAHQAGVLAHNVRLTADLRRSRQKLVSTREEERRRIRRDLHDGLGPQLASQTLTLEAIEKLIDREPETAKALLQNLKSQTREAFSEVRRLIYDLRPPVLDDLGLAAALRQEWEQNSRGEAYQDGVRISLEIPAPLPPLPAAVELAAYRIVQEAVNNALKHAYAKTCSVSLRIHQAALCLEVKDDGQGLPENLRAGVGLHSMRERAEELGGWLQVASNGNDGVRLTASLPILEPDSGVNEDP